MKTKGWVIVQGDWVIESTFSRTRTEAIDNYTEGARKPWAWFKRKYGCRAVKATQTIEI